MSAAGGEPTSMLLRQAQRERDEAQQSLKDTVADLLATQKALAASQADLTRVERLLSAAREQNTELAALYAAAALDDRDFVERELAEITEARDAAQAARKEFAAQLGDALHELAHLKFQLSMKQTQLDHLRGERDAAWELAGHTPDREEPTT